MSGTPDQPCQQLRLQTPSDLNYEVFVEARRMIAEAEQGDLHGNLTLMCSRSLSDVVAAWQFTGSIPYIVAIPDELMRDPYLWALRGRRTEVIEDRNAIC